MHRMDCTKTLRLRIKDKHTKVLAAMAREVNQVWNFCNETSHRAIRERRQWLSGYDLQKLTNGFSKCEGIHIGSPTVQQVCEDYAKARKQFKKAKLRWRVSNLQSSKYSLGWIPFKARALQYKAGQIQFAGQRFNLWDSYGLADYEMRAGSFSQDSRGRWYLNVVVKVQAKASAGTASVGIDLGLKEAAVTSTGERIEGRFYRKLECQLGIAQRAHKKNRVKAIHAKIARACHQPNPECGARPWYLSCQPNHSSGKVNYPQEIARRLVVARGNGTVLLEPGKKVLNQVALLVQVPVVAARLLAVAARGDHDSFAFALQRLDQALLCVVGFISDNAISLGVLKQDVRPFKIMALPGREVKTGRIAQGIDCGVNLRAQTASAAPDSLFLRIPPFAPALCWWARTMVESIMAYSLSASCANASKTRCQTPVLLQREWRVCTTRKSPKCSGKSRQGMPAR